MGGHAGQLSTRFDPCWVLNFGGLGQSRNRPPWPASWPIHHRSVICITIIFKKYGTNVVVYGGEGKRGWWTFPGSIRATDLQSGLEGSDLANRTYSPFPIYPNVNVQNKAFCSVHSPGRFKNRIRNFTMQKSVHAHSHPRSGSLRPKKHCKIAICCSLLPGQLRG